MSTQYATYFTGELGISATLVGALGSVFALFCIIGLMLPSKVHSLAFLFSVAYGLNVYSYMSVPAFMATDVFGKNESSVILGIISLLFALGSTLFGMIVDNFGLNTRWIVMIACVLLGYALLFTSIKKVKDQNKKLA